jgi:hypothetical protein
VMRLLKGPRGRALGVGRAGLSFSGQSSGYIDYNGELEVHSSLLDAVLLEKPPQIKIPK